MRKRMGIGFNAVFNWMKCTVLFIVLQWMELCTEFKLNNVIPCSMSLMWTRPRVL